jgi:hypothetical protein
MPATFSGRSGGRAQNTGPLWFVARRASVLVEDQASADFSRRRCPSVHVDGCGVVSTSQIRTDGSRFIFWRNVSTSVAASLWGDRPSGARAPGPANPAWELHQLARGWRRTGGAFSLDFRRRTFAVRLARPRHRPEPGGAALLAPVSGARATLRRHVPSLEHPCLSLATNFAFAPRLFPLRSIALIWIRGPPNRQPVTTHKYPLTCDT